MISQLNTESGKRPGGNQSTRIDKISAGKHLNTVGESGCLAKNRQKSPLDQLRKGLRKRESRGAECSYFLCLQGFSAEKS